MIKFVALQTAMNTGAVSDATTTTATLEFVGGNIALFSHVFLYDVLEQNKANQYVSHYTGSPITNNNDDDDDGIDSKKVAIAAAVVGAVVLIILVCAIKSGKCSSIRKCCGCEDKNNGGRGELGGEMTYARDDLEAYRRIR